MLTRSSIFKTTVVALAIFCMAPAHAIITFGLKAGVGLAKTDSDSAISEISYGTGYTGGISLDVGFAPVSLVVDALYAQRKFSIPEVSSYSYNVLHLPVQAKFHLIPLMFVSGGIYYDMVLGDTIKNYSANGNANGESAFDSDTKKADYGLVGGVGVSIPMGLTTITFEARYNHGILNLVKNPGSGEYAKNRYIDVLAGVTF